MALPEGVENLAIEADGGVVKLTNLSKPYWPGIPKRALLQHYLDVSEWLLPHLRDRAMVMRRYPQGAAGPSFFQKRSPANRPACVPMCLIEHGEGLIDFPMIQDVPGLLWVVNLGCIDLNPWYARCDDVERPDGLHFDLDPGDAPFSRVRELALAVRDVVSELGMPIYAKTSGSKGMHLTVPIVRGPLQHEVWAAAKALAFDVTRRFPALATAEYTKARRPKGRVLVDYNQNRRGATLASIYSVRPTPGATVSMPVTWAEVEAGVRIEDFDLHNAADRLREIGDLWAPILPDSAGRFDLAGALG